MFGSKAGDDRVTGIGEDDGSGGRALVVKSDRMVGRRKERGVKMRFELVIVPINNPLTASRSGGTYEPENLLL